MKQIFLSRPTWVASEHEKGLKNFTDIIKAKGLEPRTIGVTEQPIQVPMEEVIKLMRKCEGAIILGFPQIQIKEGKLKGEVISKPFSLATEWNHIEQALAHSLNLPVLSIHDKSVTRGVFDRGVGNVFLHSANFNDESWSHDDAIILALSSWSGQLKPAQATNSKSGLPKPSLMYGCYQFDGKEGLYCPACFEIKGKMIPVPRLRGGRYVCPVCKAEY